MAFLSNFQGEEQFEGRFGSLEFERPKQFDLSGEEYHHPRI